MREKIREQLGTAGLIVAVVALIASLAGGAIAASQSDGGNATASAKAKQGPRGPRGKPGKTGPAGSTGPQGPAGANGKDGATGATGSPGTPGKNGESVKFGAATTCGIPGGTKLTVGTESKDVCNGEEGEEGLQGEQGAKGDEGSPWTAGGTLPTGKTETGTWSFFATAANTGKVYAPISFTIPLAEGLGSSHVHLVSSTGNGTTCTGSVNKPTAPSGELCAYKGTLVGASSPVEEEVLTPDLNAEGASTPGGILQFTVEASLAHGTGSWAVTGAVVP